MDSKARPGAAVARTAAGEIVMSPALLITAVPDVAWLGIQELHAISLGRGAFRPRALTEDDAWGQYSASVTAVLGQLAVTDAVAGNRILGSLGDYVNVQGSLDGLEGPFLSALSSAMQLGETPEVGQAMYLLNELGLPSELGGGAQSTALFDAGTQRFTTVGADLLSDAFGSGPLDVSTARDVFGDLMRGSSTGVDDSSGAVQAVRDTGIGTAIGKQVGESLAGPVGRFFGGPVGHGARVVATDLVKGAVDLFKSIFGSGSSGSGNGRSHAAQQQASQVAQGQCVAVDKTTVTDKAQQTLVIRPDGTVEASQSTEHTSEHTSERKCPQPEQLNKCQVEDDFSGADISLGYWGGSGRTVPTMVAQGSGIDGLVAQLRGGALKLLDLPQLDAAGDVAAVGFLNEVLVQERSAVMVPDWSVLGSLDRSVLGLLDRGAVAIPNRAGTAVRSGELERAIGVLRTAPPQYVVACAVQVLLNDLHYDLPGWAS